MPSYQLHLALALGGAVITSRFALFLARYCPRPKTYMSITQDVNFADNVSDDYFLDATKPDKFINGQPIFTDGDPIDEGKFWAKIRNRKILLVFLSLAILALEVILGCLTYIAQPMKNLLFAEHVPRIMFALYIGGLLFRSVGQCTTDLHSESVIHITVLTFFSSVLHLIAAILPPSTSIWAAFGPSLAFWCIITALYALICAIIATMPCGPPLHESPSLIYSQKTIDAMTTRTHANVSGLLGASVINYLFFRYAAPVIQLGRSDSVEVGDLPILPANTRAAFQFYRMRMSLHENPHKPGWDLAWRLIKMNKIAFMTEIIVVVATAPMWFLSPFFAQKLITYLQGDPDRLHKAWGWIYALGQFASLLLVSQFDCQLWYLAEVVIQNRVRAQLNTILFAKTLVLRDVVSMSNGDEKLTQDESDEEDEQSMEFSSKAQIMTLMTTDVDRISRFSHYMYSILDSPIEIFVGTLMLYQMIGVSCFVGLVVLVLFMPFNYVASRAVLNAQGNMMKARDKRNSLMNEMLGGIRMLKFMVWERSFQHRTLLTRKKELKYLKANFRIQVAFTAIWEASPLILTLVSFWHFAVWRRQTLDPSVAFTSMLVFDEMRYALAKLPTTIMNILQVHISLKRVAKYLELDEVDHVNPLSSTSVVDAIVIESPTVTWPHCSSEDPSAASPDTFKLVDVDLKFPLGELSLIRGRLGSGKTLLLLALLGEADVSTGKVVCPRSPPHIVASFTNSTIPKAEWIMPGMCAYVPQGAWLRNASIRENILFGSPYEKERYQATLHACALNKDLRSTTFPDGDRTEISEDGVNLSGGQRARIALARAVYSRASVLLLDDVLSAVDADTARHIYTKCIRGELVLGRTVILVSHTDDLCSTDAAYIVSLDNGRVSFSGDPNSSVYCTDGDKGAANTSRPVDHSLIAPYDGANPNITVADEPSADDQASTPFMQGEKRAVGRVSRDVWELYVKSCGTYVYWAWFSFVLVLAALCPVAEKRWLETWSGSSAEEVEAKGPVHYIIIYAVIILIGVMISTYRFFILFNGTIHASAILYEKLLESVLFAKIQFHDTKPSGAILSRFGSDFVGIDTKLPNRLGKCSMLILSFLVTLVSVTLSGGVPFLIAIGVLGVIYYNVGKNFTKIARDMRRLQSEANSPLYSLCSETIAGAHVFRAFGASTMAFREMLRCVDIGTSPIYWRTAVSRWLTARYSLLSAAAIGMTGLIAVSTPAMSAARAGFILSFAATMMKTLETLVRRLATLEQYMVSLERVKDYSDLECNGLESTELSADLPTAWPHEGAIEFKNVTIRYAPHLPDVLHKLSFKIQPGEKVGIVGRTGSGKSTLASSLFRFIEPTEGCIIIDGQDISKLGLSDIRSKITMIPQHPTLFSGTLRSTLDVFNDHSDADILNALRSVQLIPTDAADHVVQGEGNEISVNVFQDLESPITEGGGNFSLGEKQLLCMARAILRLTKILVMDEATASVDKLTDELLGNTVRSQFKNSTIITIAHRLHTIIDYDRVMVLDKGKMVEFKSPAELLQDETSQFYALCMALGEDEFNKLKKSAEQAAKCKVQEHATKLEMTS